ncbi:MAG: hypothetical protein GY861_15090 [bacterium]|nr:hypothetical protein [bacterium]
MVKIVTYRCLEGCICDLVTGKHEDSETILKQASALNSSFRVSYRIHVELAILYSELDRDKDARTEAAEVLKLVPNFLVKQTS